MTAQYRRPLPLTPDLAVGNYGAHNFYGDDPRADYYTPSFPTFPAFPYPSYSARQEAERSLAPSALPTGTLLHKGFYDLLAFSANTASRFLWGAPREGEPLAGPRYESIPPRSPPPQSAPSGPATPNVSPRKGRRISKDMVSKPTNFM